jgi:hypothetical protein
MPAAPRRRFCVGEYDLSVGRAERYQQRNQVECGLRVVEGSEAGLGPRFTHGLATLEPRSIIFVPYLGGVRLFRKRPLTVAVQDVDRSELRSVAATEQLTARWGSSIVTVRTDEATLEWVLPPAQSAWAAQQVLSRS